MTGTDLLLSLLGQCATLAAVVWALTQALGKGVPWLLKVPQELIALILGPAVAVAIHWHSPDWIGVGDAVGVKGYFAAGFLGLASTVIAGKAHDWVLGPALDALARKGSPQP